MSNQSEDRERKLRRLIFDELLKANIAAEQTAKIARRALASRFAATPAKVLEQTAAIDEGANAITASTRRANSYVRQLIAPSEQNGDASKQKPAATDIDLLS